MFIRHHLHYYALCLFLFVLSWYVHNIFFIFLIIFSIYFLYKTSFVEVFVVCLIIMTVFCYHNNKTIAFNDVIEGSVIDCDEKSAIIKCEDMIVKVYHNHHLSYKDYVRMKVTLLDINENSNDYGFNEKLFFKANHIDFKAKCIELIDYSEHYSFVDFIESRLSANELVRSYQRLFILGIKDQFIEDDYSNLLELSVIHLFALSGMHLHYLKQLLRFLLSYLFGKKSIFIFTYIILLFYLMSIPYSISLFRAFFMMILYDCFKKYVNKLDIYWMLFIVFLLINPYYIYNYSFVFSFGIYLIVLLANDISYKDYYIYLLSLPLILLFQNKVHVFSFLFSLFLSLFVEYFYVLVILSLMFPWLNSLIEVFIFLLKNMILFINSFDFEIVFARPNLSFFVLYYIIGFLLLMKKQIHRKSSFEHCLLIALIISTYVHGKYPLYASVTMIDVGQGDCTLIRLPFNQGNILIDTGGNRNYDIATTTLIPYFHAIGISSLDYVYISHDDFDHCGALDSLIRNFKVKNIIRDYEKNRIIGDLDVEMLKSDRRYEDSNNQSLIMLLTLFDSKILFMGDSSIEVERDIYEKYGKLDVDILKVSHHGSLSSTGNDLFKMISPKIAMIGVGKNNIYSHPSSDVIKRLERKGCVILRTDVDGMFHIRFYGNKGYIFR